MVEEKTTNIDDIKSFAEANNLRLADKVWDFVEVDLYSQERYKPREMFYWMWSPTLKRLDRREIGEWSSWRVLKEYVDNKLIYIQDESK